jgi:hypothetical protein
MNGTFSRVACACCLQFIRLAILTYGCSTDTQGCYWEPNAALDNGFGCIPGQEILEGLGEPMVSPACIRLPHTRPTCSGMSDRSISSSTRSTKRGLKKRRSTVTSQANASTGG